MKCDQYNDYGNALTDGVLFDAVWCTFADSLGELVFSLMVFGSLGIGLYVYTGSIIIPLVLTIILGGLVVVYLPAIAVQLTVLIILLAMSVGAYLFVLRARSG